MSSAYEAYVLTTMPLGIAPHETDEARQRYADASRRAGIALSIQRLRENRPGAALRAMADSVERELAIYGLSGTHIAVAARMARLRAAHRGAQVNIPRSYEVTR